MKKLLLIWMIVLLPVCYAIDYDANGNMIYDGEYTYTYDSFNQLIHVNSSNFTENYKYDYNGNRVMKNNSYETVYYFGDYTKVINSSGSFDVVYVYADELVAIGDEFVHGDHLGSSSVVTNSSGDVVREVSYYPFGKQVGDVERGYEGKGLDDTGLNYFGARYYDSSKRIFTQPDPLMDVYNPQNLNRYAFELNNPYKYTDPDGRFVEHKKEQTTTTDKNGNKITSTHHNIYVDNELIGELSGAPSVTFEPVFDSEGKRVGVEPKYDYNVKTTDGTTMSLNDIIANDNANPWRIDSDARVISTNVAIGATSLYKPLTNKYAKGAVGIGGNAITTAQAGEALFKRKWALGLWNGLGYIPYSGIVQSPITAGYQAYYYSKNDLKEGNKIDEYGGGY